jgi:glycopeptide antibiotics resistance protein
VTNPPSAPGKLPLRYALAAAVAILIAYGSLYPFVFHDAGLLKADVSHFLASWRQPPESRGDILANLLLYIPLGLTATLAFGRSRTLGAVLGTVLAVLAGCALSLSIELAQFYDAGRVSAFSDFALNAAGVVAGVAVALMVGARLVRTSWPAGSEPAFARLLLLAWLGWRLYPYVPTLELHKYWRSLEPVLFAQKLEAYGVFRYGALWLSVIFLFRTGVRRSMSLLLLAMLAFFVAKASIIGQVISLPELVGAALALLLSPLILGRFARIGVPAMAVLLTLIVILTRVLPWQFGASSKPFQWIPFFGFLHGSQQVDAISFAQKFYLYGVVLLLLVRSGVRLRFAIALECAILFATSLLQTFMVGRSAEISDAVLALILGLIYAFVRRQSHEETGPALKGATAELSR